ncbi:BTAD domain-containing putative transcriptional regulator [Streptomyces sp. NPDC006512]|uniref:BTAD domain-containing putative transcriptional regulator n=1 Tax=Streptomyces sp. NPDC006512 TaxID=3154307 RepID=UPI0033B80473
MTVSPGGVPHTPDTVVFRILGPLQVTGHCGPVRIPPGRQEVILAALLLEANRVVSTDYLVDLIWDDEPPDTARTQVQICVSRLRKLFTTAGIAAAITTRPPGYALKTEGDLVDAAIFARRVAEARALGKRRDIAGAVELLRLAAELWQGDCLSGVSSETLRSKALQLDEERLTAAETRIDLELDLGRHHQLVGEIQLLVRVHPLRERLRGQLMLALYRSGRQAEALESYRVGRELLVEELGLEPGGELRQLERAILSGEVPPVPLPGKGEGAALRGGFRETEAPGAGFRDGADAPGTGFRAEAPGGGAWWSGRELPSPGEAGAMGAELRDAGRGADPSGAGSVGAGSVGAGSVGPLGADGGPAGARPGQSTPGAGAAGAGRPGFGAPDASAPGPGQQGAGPWGSGPVRAGSVDAEPSGPGESGGGREGARPGSTTPGAGTPGPGPSDAGRPGAGPADAGAADAGRRPGGGPARAGAAGRPLGAGAETAGPGYGGGSRFPALPGRPGGTTDALGGALLGALLAGPTDLGTGSGAPEGGRDGALGPAGTSAGGSAGLALLGHVRAGGSPGAESRPETTAGVPDGFPGTEYGPDATGGPGRLPGAEYRPETTHSPAGRTGTDYPQETPGGARGSTGAEYGPETTGGPGRLPGAEYRPETAHGPAGRTGTEYPQEITGGPGGFARAEYRLEAAGGGLPGAEYRSEGGAGRAERPGGAYGASAQGGPYREETPRQLPADTSDFVGDEEQILRIEGALLGDGTRRAVGLAVIVGKPGTGKSTLATHIAHRLSDSAFPDGQLYCDLRGTGTPATSGEVLGRFLRALGIPGPVIPESQDERAEMYRTLLASRRVLVVLDDAASESQIRPLLPGSNSCAVLVTSRVRLTGLPGAHRVELDVMGTGHAVELLVRVIGADRVAREGVAVEALIRTVGGLPLALRIVAARLAARPHWTLASMVHRLANERHRLDELTHGEMTMRASLSLTHDGLAAEDRRLLRLLSLAQGPTLPGWLAGPLLDDPRPFASDLLEPLVDVQMLDVVGMESTGGFRYRFHEIIRVFAREQLAAHHDPADQRAATARMLGGWMSLAEQAHRRIYGGDFTVLHGGAPRWEPPAGCVEELLVDPLEWLDSEHANLVQAVEHAAREGMDELCWDLAATLATLFEGRGYFDDWERTHQLALECVRSAGNTRGTAALLGSLGVLYLGRSQSEESRAALTSALGLFEELGDRQGLALCHRDLALLERMRGNEDHALTLYDRALRDFDRAGDVVGRAIVLTQSAHIWMRRGQTSAAQSRLDEALGIYRSVGYTGGQARTLRRAGQLLQGQGEHERAVTTFTEVLELCRDSGDVIGEGHLLRDLGHAHAEMGRCEAARGFYAQALSVREQIMDQGGAALVRLDLARLLAASGGTGERSRSRELLESAVRAFRDRRMGPELAEAERLLGSAPTGGSPAGRTPGSFSGTPPTVSGTVVPGAVVSGTVVSGTVVSGTVVSGAPLPGPAPAPVRAPAAGSAAGV